MIDDKEDLPKVLRFSMDINSACAGNFLEKGGIDNKAVGKRTQGSLFVDANAVGGMFLLWKLV